jgi:hypothetical protein
LAAEKPDFAATVADIYRLPHNQLSYEDLVEQLWEFYQHPLEINTASKEDLKHLRILSDEQIAYLLKHLQKNGPLVSYYELQAIPSFDTLTIRYLQPFIKITETYPPIQGVENFTGSKPINGSWLLRYGRIVEKQKGYKVNKVLGKRAYQGSPNRLATRFKWSDRRGWSLGLAGKKYPGEAFSWDPATERYGFDLWTGYLMLERKSFLKKLILGHYQVGYGQGLIVHSGFTMDKSSETIPILRAANIGLKPHNSFSNSGHRGIGATLQWKFVEQTFYYAYNSLDGAVFVDEETGEWYATTIQRSGLHRTISEIEKKSNIHEHLVGSTLIFKPGRQSEWGLNCIYTQYEVPIRPKKGQPAYSFSGKDNSNIGLFYRHLWRNFHFFGEGAQAQSGGKAGLMGFVASLTSFLDLSLLLRHYEPHFHNFYGNAFRENTAGSHNETGYYIGMGWQVIKNLKVNAYYDYFSFPAPTARISQPSDGDGWLLQATYQINRTNLILLQYRELEKAKNIPQHSPLREKGIAWAKTRKYKLRAKHKISRSVGMSSELQASTAKFLEELTGGYALAQRINYKFKKIVFAAQAAWFDTDTRNGLYFHEQALLYSKPMPALYYKQGIKTYFLVGYRPTTRWQLEGRYSLTWLVGEDRIGAGHESIEGSTKNEIAFQLIYRI